MMILLLLLTADDACKEAPAELRGVVLEGAFAHDRGCALHHVTVGSVGRYAVAEASKPVLESLGWGEKSTDKKALAALWVKRGLLVWQTPLDVAEKEFGPKTRSFEPPSISLDSDGGVRVVLWVREPPGMECGSSFRKVSYNFAANASLRDKQIVDRFFVPCGG